MSFDMSDDGGDGKFANEFTDCGEYIKFRVKGGLSWSKAEFEKTIDFFDEAEVVAKNVRDRKLIEVLAV
jgi:hypothetical protein